MATWNDVRNYIGGKYTVVNDKGSLLVIEYPTGNGRTQLVWIGGGDAVITLQSPFAKEGAVFPGKVLTHEGLFGVKVIGEMYCLTHLQLTATLDEIELDLPLKMIAEEADQLEASIGLADNL